MSFQQRPSQALIILEEYDQSYQIKKFHHIKTAELSQQSIFSTEFSEKMDQSYLFDSLDCRIRSFNQITNQIKDSNANQMNDQNASQMKDQNANQTLCAESSQYLYLDSQNQPRGIRAIKQFQKGQILLEIPEELFITEKITKHNHFFQYLINLPQQLFSNIDEKTMKSMVLRNRHSEQKSFQKIIKENKNALYLFMKRFIQTKKSETQINRKNNLKEEIQQIYIKLLPQNFNYMPDLRVEQFKSLSHRLGKMLEEKVNKDKIIYERIKFYLKKMQQIQKCSILAFYVENFTWQNFYWALKAASTRQFMCNDKNVLIPMADLINHSEKSNCNWSYDEKSKKFIITALQTIKAHQQVTICYGDKTNFELFLNFGFISEPRPELEIMSEELIFPYHLSLLKTTKHVKLQEFSIHSTIEWTTIAGLQQKIMKILQEIIGISCKYFINNELPISRIEETQFYKMLMDELYEVESEITSRKHEMKGIRKNIERKSFTKRGVEDANFVIKLLAQETLLYENYLKNLSLLAQKKEFQEKVGREVRNILNKKIKKYCKW